MSGTKERNTLAARHENQTLFPLVGIGASAGGLQALQAFFDHMSQDSGMAFVVVTHLSNDRESYLDELLQSHTNIPVRPVEGHVKIEPNHVYVLRPGKEIEVDGRRLTLHERPKHEPVRQTIDRFFYSLAEAWDGQSVGIVLTGSGSDGMRGIARIKEVGGLTMAQSPGEAQYPSMPEHAINAGHIDLVGSAGELAQRLMGVYRGDGIQGTQLTEEALSGADRKSLQKILTRLRTESGHDFAGYKRSTILRRISRRMQLHRVDSLEEYVQMLRENSKETEQLYQDLLIPVTRFFRDAEVYEVLQDKVIPRLLEGKESGDSFRVWVPGCATGEEAYSLAILLEEVRHELGISTKLQIFATDVDRQAVETGRRGRYAGTIANDVSADRLKQFFTARGNRYQVKEHVREIVLFAVHDVLQDPPFSDVDLISCRNLLIYLDRERQKQVFERFHFSLRPEGYLVLGSSESASAASDLFKTVDPANRIYRRRPGATRPLRFSTSTDQPLEWPPLGEWDAKNEMSDYSEEHRRLVVHRYGPTSILVDEDYHILDLTHGDNPFLKYPEKTPPHSIEDVVLEELRPDVRSSLFRLFKKDTSTVRKPVHVERLGKKREVLLTVRDVDFGENLAQVVLESRDDSRAEHPPVVDQESIAVSATATIRELDEELQQTKDQLRSTVERYETRTEELRSSNEELLAMNEELESTATELETREEELQAMNEELTAVNDELARKVEELEEAYSDLNNFIAATHVAAVFLDEELRVRRFTPETGDLFRFEAEKEVEPIDEVPRTFTHDRLLEDLQQVLETGANVQREVTTDDKCYVLQIRPYRTARDTVGGVVLSFFDITERKDVERKLQTINKELEERVAARTRDLEETNERLKEEMAERERLERELLAVSEEERWRIGESLHEDAGQTLTGIMLLLDDHIRRLEDDDSDAAEEVQQIRNLIENVDDRLLDLARGIIPLHLGKGEVLSRALAHLAEEMEERHGISCRVSANDDISFGSDERATHIYRIVQEAVQNAVLHGNATEVTIELDEEDRSRVLIITDNGGGPEGDIEQMGKKGMGFRFMQYRCRLLNGTFTVEEPSGGGMRVVCRFPVAK